MTCFCYRHLFNTCLHYAPKMFIRFRMFPCYCKHNSCDFSSIKSSKSLYRFFRFFRMLSYLNGSGVLFPLWVTPKKSALSYFKEKRCIHICYYYYYFSSPSSCNTLFLLQFWNCRRDIYYYACSMHGNISSIFLADVNFNRF